MQGAWQVIRWWEIRRILYNAVLLAVGIGTITIIELIGSRLAYPGEDVEEPLGILIGVVLYAIAANACYTLGWMSELLWARGDFTKTEPLRPKVFKLGLIFSAVLTFTPAIVIPLLWVIFGFQHG